MILSTAMSEVLERVLSKFPGARQVGNEKYEAPCPAHDDRHASLSIGIGDNGIVVRCHAGCPFETICDKIGLAPREFFPPRTSNGNVARAKPSNGNGHANGTPKKLYPRFEDAIAAGEWSTKGKATLRHTYRDDDVIPNVYAAVVRYDLHDGKQHRPFKKVPGGWQFGDPAQWLPYRLDQLADGNPIYVTEGEKAADAAVSIGLTATTSAHGCKAASKTDWRALAGRDVVILPDNDDPGEKYAADVAAILAKLEPPARVKVVRLPGLPEHGDIVEFAEAGGTAEQIAELAEDADLVHVDPKGAFDTAPIFPLTDAGNGERLMDRHGDNLRFVAYWKKPIVYSGERWEVDETAAADRLALETIRALKAEGARLSQSEDDTLHLLGVKYQKWAHACESAKKKRDMLSEASKVGGAVIMPDRLDSDPWLLNVRNGTIDLRTAELRPHDRNEFLTKMCPVTYDEGACCPMFLAYINAIFEGKPRLISFVKKAVGYTLTGATAERAMFFHYGIGANGKSTLLGLVRDIMGDYATQTPADTLMAKRNEGIPNDIARLKGARYVGAVETDEGKYLAEGLVKRMTGGDDVLTGRFLRAEFFDFKPEFKLHLATNHRPGIRGTDPAIWDRVKLIPYNVRYYDTREEALRECGIPDRVKDKDLPKKLRSELPGILAWAVAGCLEWQAEGLGAPEEVTKATAEYREEMDRLADWIGECCEIGETCRAAASELFGNYKNWCLQNGEHPMNQTRFGRQLTERGYTTVREGNSGRKQRLGIGVRMGPNSTEH